MDAPKSDPYREIRDQVKRFDPAGLVRYVMAMIMVPANKKHAARLEFLLKIIMSTKVKRFQGAPVTDDGIDDILEVLEDMLGEFGAGDDGLGDVDDAPPLWIRGNRFRIIPSDVGGGTHAGWRSLANDVLPVRREFARVHGYDPVDAVCGMLRVHTELAEIAEFVDPVGAVRPDLFPGQFAAADAEIAESAWLADPEAGGADPGDPGHDDAEGDKESARDWDGAGVENGSGGWRYCVRGGGMAVPLPETMRRFVEITERRRDDGPGRTYTALVGENAVGLGRSIPPDEMSVGGAYGTLMSALGIRVGDDIIPSIQHYMHHAVQDMIIKDLRMLGNTPERVSDAQDRVCRRLARLFGRDNVYPGFAISGRPPISFGVTYDGKLLAVDIAAAAKRGNDAEAVDESVDRLRSVSEHVGRGIREFAFGGRGGAAAAVAAAATAATDTADMAGSAGAGQGGGGGDGRLPDGTGVGEGGNVNIHPEVIPVVLILPSASSIQAVKDSRFMDNRASWMGMVSDFASIAECMSDGMEMITFIRDGVHAKFLRDVAAKGGLGPISDNPVVGMVQAGGTAFEYARYLVDGYTLKRLPVTPSEAMEVMGHWKTMYGETLAYKGFQPAPEGDAPDDAWERVYGNVNPSLRMDFASGRVMAAFSASGDREIRLVPGAAPGVDVPQTAYTREEAECVNLLMYAMSGRANDRQGTFGRFMDEVGVPHGSQLRFVLYPSTMVLRHRGEIPGDIVEHAEEISDSTVYVTSLGGGGGGGKDADAGSGAVPATFAVIADPAGLADMFRDDVLDAEMYTVTSMAVEIVKRFAKDGDGGWGGKKSGDDANIEIVARCIQAMFKTGMPNRSLAPPEYALPAGGDAGGPFYDDVYDGTGHYGHVRLKGEDEMNAMIAVGMHLQSGTDVEPGTYTGSDAASIMRAIIVGIEDMLADMISTYDVKSMLAFAVDQKGLAIKSIMIWGDVSAGLWDSIPPEFDDEKYLFVDEDDEGDMDDEDDVDDGYIQGLEPPPEAERWKANVYAKNEILGAINASSMLIEMAVVHGNAAGGSARMSVETWLRMFAMADVMLNMRQHAEVLSGDKGAVLEIREDYRVDVRSNRGKRQQAAKSGRADGDDGDGDGGDGDDAKDVMSTVDKVRLACRDYAVREGAAGTVAVGLPDLVEYVCGRFADLDRGDVEGAVDALTYSRARCQADREEGARLGQTCLDPLHRFDHQDAMPILACGDGQGLVTCLFNAWLLVD